MPEAPPRQRGQHTGQPLRCCSLQWRRDPLPERPCSGCGAIHSMRARCSAPGEPLPPVVLTGLPRDQGVSRGTGPSRTPSPHAGVPAVCPVLWGDPRRWRCPSASGPPAVPVGAGEQRTGPSWAVSAPDRAPGVSATDRPMQGAGSPATTALCC